MCVCVCVCVCRLREPLSDDHLLQYSEGFYRQTPGCVMGSPVSPAVVTFYMEEVESTDHLHRNCSKPLDQVCGRHLGQNQNINAVDGKIKFTKEDVRGDSLPFLDCPVHTDDDWSLNTEVYRKPSHIGTFHFHHQLEPKLGVITTLNHRQREGGGTEAHQGST